MALRITACQQGGSAVVMDCDRKPASQRGFEHKMNPAKHPRRNRGRAFWLPPQCVSKHPQKCFSYRAPLRRCIWDSDLPVPPVSPESTSHFGGGNGSPQPATCGVSRCFLPQTSTVPEIKKRLKPPIGGVLELTGRRTVRYNPLIRGMNNGIGCGRKDQFNRIK